jgi:uncharacterized protein YkwD
MMRTILITACCLLFLTTFIRAQDDEEEIQHGPLTPKYIEQFTQDVVKFHNIYREKHGQGALVLNTTMSGIAQREALRLFNLKRIEMYNPALRNFGKNFAQAKTSEFSEYEGIKNIIN